MFDNPVGLILALIGSAGLGGFFKEIVTGIKTLKSGVSIREKSRKRDLLSERDYEYIRAEALDHNRSLAMEYAQILRRYIIENVSDAVIPPWPRFVELPKRPTQKTDTENTEGDGAKASS